MERFLDVLLDSAVDTAKMLPFLFLAYLVIEYAQRRQGDRLIRLLGSGRLGPAAGALLGCFPQCGFSAMAADLYAGRVISLGTLLAVFLSTSDEAVPLLLATPGSGGLLLRLIGVKLAAGLLTGLVVDLLLPPTAGFAAPPATADCSHEGCGCGCEGEHHLLGAALLRTLHTGWVVLLLSLAIGLVVGLVGEETLAVWLGALGSWQVVAAALLGLVPNCAVSLLLTQLFLAGEITFGAAVAGLSTGAGVGLVVLFHRNRPRSDSLRVLGLLTAAGTVTGLLCTALGL